METNFELTEIKEVSDELDCKMCSRPVQDPDEPGQVDLGSLYEYGVCRAHHFCLMFSSGLEQRGEEDQGIKGFLPDEIIKEWKRGSFLKCCYCKKKQATVGCLAPGCRKCYHLPCGLENGSLQQFFGNFGSFCFDHRPIQETKHKPGSKKSRECGICLDNLNPKSYQNLYSPCCGGYFHRGCMRKMAYTSGVHFFKCPLCNNRDDFTEEMLKFGIYVPDQDAKWETDDGGFEDLLVRPESCDAEVCLCPNGRSVDEEDTKWETIICVVCGSKGIHIECGGLNFDRPRWKCDICRDLLRNVPSRPVSVFNTVKLDSPHQDSQQLLAGLAERTKFKLKCVGAGKLKWDNLEVTVGSVCLSFEPAPAVNVPLPVNLYSDQKRPKLKEIIEKENIDTSLNISEEILSPSEKEENSGDKENEDRNISKKYQGSPSKSSSNSKRQSTISQFFFPRQIIEEQNAASPQKVSRDLKEARSSPAKRKRDSLETVLVSPAKNMSHIEVMTSPKKKLKIDSSNNVEGKSVRVSSGTGGFVCQYCRISFSSLVTWKQHETSHRTGSWCGFCDQKFDSEKQLKKHQKEKHTGCEETDDLTEYECLQCTFTSKTKKGLKIHNTRQHGTKADISMDESANNTDNSPVDFIIKSSSSSKDSEKSSLSSTTSPTDKEDIVNTDDYDTDGNEIKSDEENDADELDAYKCDFCPAIFVGKKSVLRHMATQHEDGESLDSKVSTESIEDEKNDSENDSSDEEESSSNKALNDKISKIMEEWD